MLVAINTILLCALSYTCFKIYQKLPGKTKTTFQDDIENFGKTMRRGAEDAYYSVKENAPKAAEAVRENAVRAYTSMKTEFPTIRENVANMIVKNGVSEIVKTKPATKAKPKTTAAAKNTTKTTAKKPAKKVVASKKTVKAKSKTK